MKISTSSFCVVLLPMVIGPTSGAGTLPKTVDSSPCRTAPAIDGAIGDEEWRDAPVLRFELSVIRLDPPTTETRSCELRVMNSANALYVALRVPDATVDNSLAPLMLDAAILAFGKGDQVRPGDDRKVIAQGMYRDKYVSAPGKDDADDPRQDGRGGMTREKGICSFEWAIPLEPGDPNDLRAKPGNSVRFNLAYFDALQLPLTKARMGGLYGVQLDRADGWGTLRLAADVKDDGGTAFQGPDWIKDRLAGARSGLATRLRLEETTLVAGANPPRARALVSFTYRDPQGIEREAKAKLWLPDSLRSNPGAKVPLYFNAGYELTDGGEQDFVKRGWMVASPRDLPANPLIRTANPDIALLHIVRGLAFVDVGRVMIAGGSAGGYMTLLLAAETFPLAGAAPDVPPVNWGYNAAYFFMQMDRAAPPDGSPSKLPFLAAVAKILQDCQKVYRGGYGDVVWYNHSPIAHVPTITCPVSVAWTTADMLVPMNQVGARWVQHFSTSEFPKEFTMEPEKLLQSRAGRTTLMDVLSERDYEVFTLTIPKDTPRLGLPPGSGKPVTRELPTSADKPWSIVILDEGPPEPALGHFKYNLRLTRDAFFDRVNTGKIPARQLTAIKLERLMDRYAGKESPPSPLHHLDLPESERSDVLRGLRTYVSSGPENARTFADLYSKLAPARQVLEADVVKEFQMAH